jgi:hypothetical protein
VHFFTSQSNRGWQSAEVFPPPNRHIFFAFIYLLLDLFLLLQPCSFFSKIYCSHPFFHRLWLRLGLQKCCASCRSHSHERVLVHLGEQHWRNAFSASAGLRSPKAASTGVSEASLLHLASTLHATSLPLSDAANYFKLAETITVTEREAPSPIILAVATSHETPFFTNHATPTRPDSRLPSDETLLPESTHTDSNDQPTIDEEHDNAHVCYNSYATFTSSSNSSVPPIQNCYYLCVYY